MACQAYKVTFKMPEGQESTIEVPPDSYILDVAEVSRCPLTWKGGSISELRNSLSRSATAEGGEGESELSC
jgi:hypothetical protein